MIPIKIHGKKYKIKSIYELTTKEYIEFSKIKNPDYVKFIAWQTGFEEKEAFFAVISKTVQKQMGKFDDITTMKPIWKSLDKNKTVFSVGQRHQIEQSKREGFEFLVYVLAVAQVVSINIDDVEKRYNYYLTKPWFEILPAGFFFFRILRSGKTSGTRLSRILYKLIKTKVLKNRPELIG